VARPKKASLYKVDGIFYVSYWRDGKRVRETDGTNNRKIAEEVRRQREIAMLTGTTELQAKVTAALNDPVARGAVLTALEPQSIVSISRLKGEYLVHAKTVKRPKTIANDMGRLNSFLSGLTVLNAAQVTTQHIDEHMAKKVEKDKNKPATILRIREILHAFFEFAKALGYVKANPVDGTNRPTLPERDIRYLSLQVPDLSSFAEAALQGGGGSSLDVSTAPRDRSSCAPAGAMEDKEVAGKVEGDISQVVQD
jgi:hypothetical protein